MGRKMLSFCSWFHNPSLCNSQIESNSSRQSTYPGAISKWRIVGMYLGTYFCRLLCRLETDTDIKFDFFKNEHLLNEQRLGKHASDEQTPGGKDNDSWLASCFVSCIWQVPEDESHGLSHSESRVSPVHRAWKGNTTLEDSEVNQSPIVHAIDEILCYSGIWTRHIWILDLLSCNSVLRTPYRVTRWCSHTL